MRTKAPVVLLINPWIYDFAAYDMWARPLGLLYIAGILRENGFDIHFIDCLSPGGMETKGVLRRKYGDGRFPKVEIEKPVLLQGIPRKYSRYGISPGLFEAELREVPRPDVILVTSVMTYWYPGVFSVIERAKRSFPAVPVVLGGVYATLCHEHALDYSGADFCLKGEGEASVLSLLCRLTNWDSTCIPDGNKLDSYPYPAFDLLRDHDAICLITARGCPYDCAYCASSLLRNSFRPRHPSKVLDEISYWVERYPVKNIVFYDDALLYRAEERFIPLLKGIDKEKICCNFHTPNGLHARDITQEVADLMHQTGFRTVRLGFETSDDCLHARTGGKITCREFERAVGFLRKAGYAEDDIGVYLLAGLPGQGIDEVKRSIGYVRECGARPVLAEYSPIPGTKLWKDAREHSSFNLDEPLFQNNSILPCRIGGLSWEDYYQLKSELKDGTR